MEPLPIPTPSLPPSFLSTLLPPISLFTPASLPSLFPLPSPPYLCFHKRSGIRIPSHSRLVSITMTTGAVLSSQSP